jgi:hypothetical protein
LIPAALRKTIDAVVLLSVPVNVSAVPAVPERSGSVRAMSIVAPWPVAASTRSNVDSLVGQRVMVIFIKALKVT